MPRRVAVRYRATPPPPPLLSPIQLLPVEILLEIYELVCDSGSTFDCRLARAVSFGNTCRAFRHAQLLAPQVRELSLGGRDGLWYGIEELKAGRLDPARVEQLDLDASPADLIVMAGVINEVRVKVRGLRVALAGNAVRRSAGGSQWTDMVRVLLDTVRKCDKLERLEFTGSQGLVLFSAAEIYKCLASLPLLEHFEYNNLSLGTDSHLDYHGRRNLPALISLSLPVDRHSAALDLAELAIKASAASLRHLSLRTDTLSRHDFARLLKPVAATLVTLKYDRVQRITCSIANAILRLRAPKHLVMSINSWITKTVVDTLTDKASDPAHAPLESATVLSEPLTRLTKKEHKLPSDTRAKLVELAKVIKTRKVRIGSATIQGAGEFAATLKERGIEVDVVGEDELLRGGPRETWVWD